MKDLSFRLWPTRTSRSNLRCSNRPRVQRSVEQHNDTDDQKANGGLPIKRSCLRMQSSLRTGSDNVSATTNLKKWLCNTTGTSSTMSKSSISSFESGFSGTWRVAADRGPTDGYMSTTVVVNISAEGRRPDLGTELASAHTAQMQTIPSVNCSNEVGNEVVLLPSLCPKYPMWSSYVTWNVSPSVRIRLRQRGRQTTPEQGDTCPKLRLPRAAASSTPEERIGSGAAARD